MDVFREECYGMEHDGSADIGDAVSERVDSLVKQIWSSVEYQSACEEIDRIVYKDTRSADRGYSLRRHSNKTRHHESPSRGGSTGRLHFTRPFYTRAIKDIPTTAGIPELDGIGENFSDDMVALTVPGELSKVASQIKSRKNNCRKFHSSSSQYFIHSGLELSASKPQPNTAASETPLTDETRRNAEYDSSNDAFGNALASASGELESTETDINAFIDQSIHEWRRALNGQFNTLNIAQKIQFDFSTCQLSFEPDDCLGGTSDMRRDCQLASAAVSFDSDANMTSCDNPNNEIIDGTAACGIKFIEAGECPGPGRICESQVPSQKEAKLQISPAKTEHQILSVIIGEEPNRLVTGTSVDQSNLTASLRDLRNILQGWICEFRRRKERVCAISSFRVRLRLKRSFREWHATVSEKKRVSILKELQHEHKLEETADRFRGLYLKQKGFQTWMVNVIAATEQQASERQRSYEAKEIQRQTVIAQRYRDLYLSRDVFLCWKRQTSASIELKKLQQKKEEIRGKIEQKLKQRHERPREKGKSLVATCRTDSQSRRNNTKEKLQMSGGTPTAEANCKKDVLDNSEREKIRKERGIVAASDIRSESKDNGSEAESGTEKSCHSQSDTSKGLKKRKGRRIQTKPFEIGPASSRVQDGCPRVATRENLSIASLERRIAACEINLSIAHYNRALSKSLTRLNLPVLACGVFRFGWNCWKRYIKAQVARVHQADMHYKRRLRLEYMTHWKVVMVPRHWEYVLMEVDNLGKARTYDMRHRVRKILIDWRDTTCTSLYAKEKNKRRTMQMWKEILLTARELQKSAEATSRRLLAQRYFTPWIKSATALRESREEAELRSEIDARHHLRKCKLFFLFTTWKEHYRREKQQRHKQRTLDKVMQWIHHHRQQKHQTCLTS